MLVDIVDIIGALQGNGKAGYGAAPPPIVCGSMAAYVYKHTPPHTAL